MLRDLWTARKGLVVGVAVAVAVVLVALVVIAAVPGARGASRTVSRAAPTAGASGVLPSSATPGVPSTNPAPPTSGAAFSAVPSPQTGYPTGRWATVPTIAPAVSGRYPAITGDALHQQDLFAAAFGTTLFTRDYAASTRDQLVAWAQACSAPLTIQQVPLSAADRAKILVQSLTLSSWDPGQMEPVVPDAATWASLAAAGAHTTVSNVQVQPVSPAAFPPANTTFTRPTFDRLFAATVTLHTASGVQVQSVALEIVMTAADGRFGASEVQHFVNKPQG